MLCMKCFSIKQDYIYSLTLTKCFVCLNTTTTKFNDLLVSSVNFVNEHFHE